MNYARINLKKTNYTMLPDWYYIRHPDPMELNLIYRTYCEYKNFSSVVPIFDQQYSDSNADIIGYQNRGQLIAFSLIKKYSAVEAECLQFAWDYKNPKLRLGIESLKNECAIYKALGFTYLYVGGADTYKQSFDGFELLGKLE
jgi:hypothetical protein